MLLHFNITKLPSITHIGYVSYKKPWSHFKRLTDEYILYIIKNGELYIEEDGQKYELRRGDFLLLQPALIHWGYKKACCDYYYIHFKHHDVFEVDSPLDKITNEINFSRNSYIENCFEIENYSQASACYLPKYYHISNESTLIYLFFMLKEILEDYYKINEYKKNLVSCKLTELIIRVSKEYMDTNISMTKSPYPKAFIKCQALLDYLNNEYHQKIKSQDIQQRFELTYAYLNRVFRRMTGHTILNYLNIVRIKKAAELIENTTINFSEIGYLVGIDDPYYFSKTFKKHTGLSPMQYRKKMFAKTQPSCL